MQIIFGKEFIIKSLLNPRLAHVISFLLIMVLMREPRETNYNCQPAELVRALGGAGGVGQGGQGGQTVS